MESTPDLATANLSDWFRLMKPGVLALLQVTAMCTILIHDLIVWNAAGRIDFDIFSTLETMGIVFVGGYLTAGGAHTFNNVLDRDIDPQMRRTENRAIARGAITPKAGLIWALFLSFSGRKDGHAHDRITTRSLATFSANPIVPLWADARLQPPGLAHRLPRLDVGPGPGGDRLDGSSGGRFDRQPRREATSRPLLAANG